MILTDIIKRMAKDYCVIVTGTLIGMIIYCKWFYSNDPFLFNIDTLIQILLFALAGDLPTLIFYSPKELSEKQWIVREILHFIILEIVLLSFGAFLDWISLDIAQMGLLGLLIVLVYVVVVTVGWRLDKKTTTQINERLKILKNELEEE